MVVWTPLKIRCGLLTIAQKDQCTPEGARPGGERAGTRTLDLLIKSQLLYQLSYALGRLSIAAGRTVGAARGAVNAAPAARQRKAQLSVASPASRDHNAETSAWNSANLPPRIAARIFAISA